MSMEVRSSPLFQDAAHANISAFGIFARALPEEDAYKILRNRVEGIELADSITVDGHKLLNVVSIPYPFGLIMTGLGSLT
jgi:glutamate/tyrosine decarboxylase-like PLP-dependent enzyme